MLQLLVTSSKWPPNNSQPTNLSNKHLYNVIVEVLHWLLMTWLYAPSHCRRNRALTPGESPYTVVAESISIEDTGCQMDILNTRTNVLLRAEVSTLDDSMFRLKIKEKSPIRPRYEVEGALVSEPKLERWILSENTCLPVLLYVTWCNSLNHVISQSAYVQCMCVHVDTVTLNTTAVRFREQAVD